jgi:hypothetical protein
MKNVLGLVAGLIACSLVIADDVIEDNGNGGINWTKGIIYANGYGVAPSDAPKRKKQMLARRAAQVDAYRNLAEILEGVRVTSETVIKDMTLESDAVRTKIEGLVRGAVMSSDHYQNEVAEVTMQIAIDGGLAAVINQSERVKRGGDLTLYEQFQLKVETIAAALGPNKAYAAERLINSANELEFAQRLLAQSQNTDLKALLEGEINAYGDTSIFTGLLIDATSVNDFELATIPRIRNEAGDVIYPRSELFDETLSAKRPVSYDFDVNDAISNDRVAINPYIIRAKSTFKARHSDLVIDEDSAKLIEGNTRLMDIINTAGVMIVVAP